MAVEWVVLDAMGVVFEVGDDANELLVPYVRKVLPAMTRRRINELYLEASLGQLSSYDFWRGLGLAERYPMIEQRYLDDRLTLDGEFREVAVELRKRFRTALFSNDVKEWSEYVRKKRNLNRLFDVVVVSGECGCRKPDPRIYEVLLDRVGAPASACVLVDDRAKNLVPAREMGFHTIRFARGKSEAGAPEFPEISGFGELPGTIAALKGEGTCEP